jgi:hypothetical protein
MSHVAYTNQSCSFHIQVSNRDHLFLQLMRRQHIHFSFPYVSCPHYHFALSHSYRVPRKTYLFPFLPRVQAAGLHTDHFCSPTRHVPDYHFPVFIQAVRQENISVCLPLAHGIT